MHGLAANEADEGSDFIIHDDRGMVGVVRKDVAGNAKFHQSFGEQDGMPFGAACDHRRMEKKTF